MRKSRQEVQKIIEEALRMLPKQPATPLYQKVVLVVLALGALVGLVGVLFFR